MDDEAFSALRFSYIFNTSTTTEIFSLWLLKCYINPIISILGLASNSLGIVILWQSGLQKAPNVLLLGLSLADSMAIFDSINIAETLYFFDPSKKYPNVHGWQYDKDTALTLYLLKHICHFLGDWGAYVNTTIPVLITCNRLAAIYFPLTFRKYTTRRFAVVGIVLSFVCWLPWSVFHHFLTTFDYVRISNDTLMGVFKVSEIYSNRAEVIDIFDAYIFESMSSWIPVALVLAGCLAIWIKIRLSGKKRKELTSCSRRVASTKTTRTLLASCMLFALTHILYSILIYIFNPDFVFFRRGYVVYEFMHLIYLCNNASNFFIYVTCNSKLWRICHQMFSRNT
jgi:Serpentine type 7TM GPCR chemoreceptor Srw